MEGDVGKPKTQREWILQLSGYLDKLSASIDRLDKTLDEIENKKLVSLEKRITALEKWMQETNGSWKAVSAAAVVLSIISMLFAIFKR